MRFQTYYPGDLMMKKMPQHTGVAEGNPGSGKGLRE